MKCWRRRTFSIKDTIFFSNAYENRPSVMMSVDRLLNFPCLVLHVKCSKPLKNLISFSRIFSQISKSFILKSSSNLLHITQRCCNIPKRLSLHQRSEPASYLKTVGAKDLHHHTRHRISSLAYHPAFKAIRCHSAVIHSASEARNARRNKHCCFAVCFVSLYE